MGSDAGIEKSGFLEEGVQTLKLDVTQMDYVTC